MGVGAQDVQGLPVLVKPASRQCYAPMGSKPAPCSNDPLGQWNQAPVINISVENKGREQVGEGGGSRAQSKG